MRPTRRILEVVVLLASISASAQVLNVSNTSPAAPAYKSQRVLVPTGTEMSAVLNTAIDSQKAHVGDRVQATLVEDVNIQGRTVLTRQTRLVGRIVEVYPATAGQQRSSVGLVFQTAILPGGHVVSVRAGIEEIAAAANREPAHALNVDDAPVVVIIHNAPAADPANSTPAPRATARGSNGVEFVIHCPMSGNSASDGSLFTADDGNVKLAAGTRITLRETSDNVSSRTSNRPARLHTIAAHN